MNDAAFWNDRYASSELLWSAEPNVWLAQIAGELEPGYALDLGAGEGRNCVWLAERGWQVTAVDISDVALQRAQAIADRRLSPASGTFRTVLDDVSTYEPEGQYNLVLLAYMHLPHTERWRMFHSAAQAVAPGGLLVVIAHDSTNLTEGVGGPQDPAVLYSPDDVLDCLESTNFTVVRADRAHRSVEGKERPAIDAVVVLRRPA